MPYVIANTSLDSQMVYVFNAKSSDMKIEWSLLKLKNSRHDLEGSILLTSEVLRELEENNVPIFESKKTAREAYHKLGLSTCKYVPLILPITFEFQSRSISIKKQIY